MVRMRRQIALAGVLLGLALLAGPPVEARLNARGRARATKTRIAASAELRAREPASAPAAAGASRRRHLQDDYTVLGASDGEEWNAEGQALLDTGSESFSSGAHPVPARVLCTQNAWPDANVPNNPFPLLGTACNAHPVRRPAPREHAHAASRHLTIAARRAQV